MDNCTVTTTNNIIQCDGQTLYFETIILNIISVVDKSCDKTNIGCYIFNLLTGLVFFIPLFISHFCRLIITSIIKNIVFYIKSIISFVIKVINKILI
jgi:hypothetical protein